MRWFDEDREGGRFIAFGRCWSCGRTFTFDPDRVPSVPIDSHTNRPLDVDASGRPQDFTADEYARAVKQPVCRHCVEEANRYRKADDRPLIEVLPGAYPDGD